MNILEASGAHDPGNPQRADEKVGRESPVVTVVSSGADRPKSPGALLAPVRSSCPPFWTMGIDSRDLACRH